MQKNKYELLAYISSCSLANTVLNKKIEVDTIFELASGGFEGSVSLAKNSPGEYILPILDNKIELSSLISLNIQELERFKICLEKEDLLGVIGLIENANTFIMK